MGATDIVDLEVKSQAFFDLEPSRSMKLVGKTAATIGNLIEKRLPTRMFASVERVAYDLITRSKGVTISEEDFEPQCITQTVKHADHVYAVALGKFYVEGSLASSAISLAGAGGYLPSFGWSSQRCPSLMD